KKWAQGSLLDEIMAQTRCKK
nr:Chain X, VIPB [Vibrio cholerae V52]3ZRJ_Y Chain Y, VIPB [Vibrio cholerae V52]